MEDHVHSVLFDDLSGPRITNMNLVAPLADDELAELGAQLAAVDQQIVDAKNNKKTTMKEWNDEIKELESDQKTILEQMSTKSRTKVVQCEVRYDWKAGKKYMKRLDTGAIVDEAGVGPPER